MSVKKEAENSSLKKVKTLCEAKQILSWFDNHHYERKIINFSLKDWLSEFEYRSHWRYFLGDASQNRLNEEQMLLYARHIAKIGSQSLGPEKADIECRIEPHEFSYSPVRSIKPSHLAAHAGDVFFSELVSSLKIDAVDFLAGGMDSTELEVFDHIPVHLINKNRYPDIVEASNGEILASIDILAPDEIIIDGIKEWLKQVRKDFAIAAPEKGSFGDKDMKKWREFRVLQYIDITLFAQLSNLELTQYQIGEILFHDELCPAPERVRKTVKPEADRMLDRHSLARFSLQLAYET
ncbi:DUF6387 family protein [Chitinibacter sp. FCG-7]|uniref:DUF6387 family protein n=1 Tax=Chitinibacter mangrovi TaxID=3153927 RepID=A0AAU7F7V5_9NEIS